MNRKITILFLLTNLIFSLHIFGQELLPVKKSELIDNGGERKILYSKIKDAFLLYEKGLGYVGNSLLLFLEAYQQNQQNPELNFNIGVCYLIAGPKDEALPYLLTADSLKQNISEDIHFFIGLAHQYRNEFSKAIAHFKMNIELMKQNKSQYNIDLTALSEKHIQECKNGKVITENNSQVVENLGETVNSQYDDFNPAWIDNALYFSSRKEGQEKLRSEADQKFFEKIYKTKQNEKKWLPPELERTNFGAKNNVAIFSKCNDNQSVLYVSGVGNGNVFFAEKSKGKWNLEKKLKFLNERSSRESSASLTEDGNQIYFISNRKGGFGKCDIYYSIKNEKNKWSKPINIGGDINTKYDEGDVFVTGDGQELYFSSKGHNSIGGYDIFKCERLSSGKWGKPVNMGLPVNSTDNDITFFKSSGGMCFFASERSNGYGGFDLYTIKSIQPEVQEVAEEIMKETEFGKEVINPVVIPEIPAKAAVELTEIELKQELVKEDFVYRVQIAASKKKMTTADLSKKYKGEDVIEHLYVEGWHKYTIGGFDTYEEAAAYRDKCGVSDAFVVLFKGGYRLGIARKMTK